jgi:hypothetical protein
MRRKLSAIFLILSCLSASAQEFGPKLQNLTQGSGITIGGRAHIIRAPQGTYIKIENPNLSLQVYGFVAFGNQPTFPGLYDIDGRDVELTGIIVMDGRAIIQMNDARQLRLKS